MFSCSDFIGGGEEFARLHGRQALQARREGRGPARAEQAVHRAIAKQAEGEQLAAQKLVEAATIMASAHGAMQLRYLGALHDIASDRTNTFALPLPTDVLEALSVRDKATSRA